MVHYSYSMKGYPSTSSTCQRTRKERRIPTFARCSLRPWYWFVSPGVNAMLPPTHNHLCHWTSKALFLCIIQTAFNSEKKQFACWKYSYLYVCLFCTQLTATKVGRQILKARNVYAIMREFHNWEKELHVAAACEKLIQVNYEYNLHTFVCTKVQKHTYGLP